MELLKLKKILMILGPIAIVVTLLIDMSIKQGTIPYFQINKNYIYYIFSGICTVATLGSAFIGIFINISSNKYFGFTLKEIIKFKSVGISFTNIVCVSLGSIILSIPILAITFATSMTFLAILMTAYILINYAILGNILSNEDILKNTIIVEIEKQIKTADNPKLIDWINRWLPELEVAIENSNGQVQDDYISLIKKIAFVSQEKSRNDVRFRLEDGIGKAFIKANDYLGIVDAYQKIINLNSTKDTSIFDERSILEKSINRLEYYNAEELSKTDFSGNIRDIISKLKIHESIAIFILIRYYISIYSNTVIGEELKFKLLEIYFQELCMLLSEDVNNVGIKTLIYIYKHGILQNEKEEDRIRMYLILVKQLYLKNHYIEENGYIPAISLLFRAIYFYSFIEIESINPEYRRKLKLILNQKVETMDNVEISLPMMIKKYSDPVVKFLIKNSFVENHFDEFEYFSPGIGVKTPVSTIERKMGFAFYLYCIFGYKFSKFPIEEYLEDGDISENIKRRLCKSILGVYNDDGILNQQAKNDINQLQMCLEVKEILPESYFKKTYDYLNDYLIKLEETQTGEIVKDIKKESLQKRLDELMRGNPLIELDDNLDLVSAGEYQIKPHYERVFPNHEQMVAREIQHSICEAVNIIIEEILYPVKLKFNKEGVLKLLNEIEGRKINFRNYTFVDDWGIDAETRKSSEYEKLRTLISEIEPKYTNEINHHLFLSNGGVKVNAEIVSFLQENLTEDQIDKYVETFKVAEARYKIDGVVYDKERAINRVKSNIVIVSAVFKVKTNIDENSGFRIVFR